MSATAVQSRALPKLEIPTYNDSEDRYTVASTASTNFTIHSQFSTNTENYIPVSRLSRHSFKLRSTSSFPNILNLYQEPITEEEGDTDRKQDRKKKEEKRKKERRGKKTGIDWEAIIEKRSKHETRDISHQRATSPEDKQDTMNRAIRIEAIARDQMEKYETYIANLHKKVTKQREDRQTRNEELAEKFVKEEQERARYTPRKRRKHKYVHDMRYLKKIPKSKMSKMVHLSDDLQKKGVLRHQGEVDKFWKDFGTSGLHEEDIFQSDPVHQVPDATEYVTEKPRIKRKSRSKKGLHYKKKSLPEHLRGDPFIEKGEDNEKSVTIKSREHNDEHKREKEGKRREHMKNISKSLPDNGPQDLLIDEGERTAREI